ncbi:MAG: AAA family ATPase [Candidatus Micrarchaeia archaeon]
MPASPTQSSGQQQPSNKAKAQSKRGISFGKRSQKAIIHPKASHIPLSSYWFKDVVKDFVSHKNFADALAITFAIISVSLALPFIPWPILIVLVIVAFALTMLHPLLGLVAMLFETLPMFIYQAPLLAWIFMIFISISLFAGFKHYRTITAIYALTALPFSSIGYFLEIPAFTITILGIGIKRSAIAAMIVVPIIVMISGATAIQNTGSIVYNPAQAHSYIVSAMPVTASIIAPSMAAPALSSFAASWNAALAKFASFEVTSRLFKGVSALLESLKFNLPLVAIQLAIWLIVVFAMGNYAIKSRSKYKGTLASLFSGIIPLSYIAFSYFTLENFSWYPVISFAATPIVIFLLEFYDVPIVQALAVMKQDVREKFGAAFEDISGGGRETLDDVADYEHTKEELKEAILAPIEHRELQAAYGIKPAKGILLFGPPGTGKTYIMRALANEIRAGFFYIKVSSILSPYPGESVKELANIFAVARKHAPCILFLDEIDSIAVSREVQETESGRQLLSEMLTEMDGFQKIEDVVIVGATNVPHLLDPSIMRPGRFDKVIYLPLPDLHGRKEIFKYYLKKMPISDDVDMQKLAEMTDRYSAADIKNLCEEITRHIADEAVSQNKMLQVTMADIVRAIKATKPSTSLAQLEEYERFRLDYERRSNPEVAEKRADAIGINDVVGLESAKKALYEAVEVPIMHPELIKKYDIKNITGILLFGPPGNGKTMLMRAIANEVGDVHMITIAGSEISKYGPEKAVNIVKQAFDTAKENAPSILFIDEIDALVPSRDKASELGIQLTGEFLEEMDGIKDKYNIVIVGATNRPEALDNALLRAGRFDKLIFVPPPEKAERAKIFELNLSKAPLADDVDFNKLGEMTPGYTGADIANICRQVKMNALEQSLSTESEVKIGMNDIAKIVQSTRPSAPSIVVGRYLSFLATYGER